MNWRRGSSRSYGRDYGYPEYVPVGVRRIQGIAKAQKKIGKGKSLQPVTITGTKIATTFWGKGWCKHFETYSDFSNRLPRGRTYARNGSIAHLEITSGHISAFVCGSDLYKIEIEITPLPPNVWKQLCENCTASVTSVIDLMRGRLPDDVVTALTDPKNGMFPSNREIKLSCDCPDGARLCKHLAAVLYGVGNRLDQSPELLFVLRGVSQTDLVGASLTKSVDSLTSSADGSTTLAEADLSELFGIDLVADESHSPVMPATKKKSTKKRAVKKKPPKGTAVKMETANKKPAEKATVKKKTERKTPAIKKKPAKKKPAKKKAAKKNIS
ncbi:MAG: SWIM zinc finger family protein [Pirellulaceae bacterium]